MIYSNRQTALLWMFTGQVRVQSLKPATITVKEPPFKHQVVPSQSNHSDQSRWERTQILWRTRIIKSQLRQFLSETKKTVMKMKLFGEEQLKARWRVRSTRRDARPWSLIIFKAMNFKTEKIYSNRSMFRTRSQTLEVVFDPFLPLMLQQMPFKVVGWMQTQTLRIVWYLANLREARNKSWERWPLQKWTCPPKYKTKRRVSWADLWINWMATNMNKFSTKYSCSKKFRKLKAEKRWL